MSCISNMIPELELGSMFVHRLSNDWAKECWQQHWTFGLKNAGSNTEHFTLPFAKLWRGLLNQFTLAVYKAGLSFSQPINFCKASYLCNICHICDTSVHPSSLNKFLYSCGSQAEFTCMAIFRSEKNVTFACKTCRAKVNNFIDSNVFYENMLGGCSSPNQSHRTVLHMW